MNATTTAPVSISRAPECDAQLGTAAYVDDVTGTIVTVTAADADGVQRVVVSGLDSAEVSAWTVGTELGWLAAERSGFSTGTYRLGTREVLLDGRAARSLIGAVREVVALAPVFRGCR